MEDSGLWWTGYGPDAGWWRYPPPGDSAVYFLFVEDAEEMAATGTLDGPDGSDLDLDHPTLKEAPVRFRTSGIAAAEFARWMGEFEELDPDTAEPGQRRARLATLRAFFKEVRLPIVDIYVLRTDEELRAMRLALVPGSWHLAHIEFGDGDRSRRPVYASDGAAAEAPGFRGGGLVRLVPVLPPVELRLRDIFSLNHVPDGEVDPEEGDDSAPFDAPRPGTRPMGGGEAETMEAAVAAAMERVFEGESEEEEAPAQQQTYSRESDYWVRAKRRLTQSQGGGD